MASILFPVLAQLSWKAWLFGIFPSLTALYYVGWIIYARTLHPLASVPGPFWASVTRLWYMWQIVRGDMEHTQRALHKKYGPLLRIAPNEVSCADPDSIKKIYPLQNPLEKTDFYPVWGAPQISPHPDVFTCTNEKLHGQRRRIFNHVYSLSNVLQSESYIDKCSNLLIKRLGEHADENKPINLGEWLQMYAFDVIGELFYGRMFGFMENSHDHGSYIHSLDTLMPPLCVTAIAPTYLRPFILGSAIVVPAARKALKAIEAIHTAAVAGVAERSDQIEKGMEPRNDLLQQLLEIAREKGEKVQFGIHEVELESYVAIFAGSDTTAVALRTILYHLMKYPQASSKLQAELDGAYSSGAASSPIKYSEAQKLPYLCAVIKEAMRLHPSVGLNMQRYAPAEGIELCGKTIPKGFRVGCNPAVVHYDKGVFGNDADNFRPERWIEGDERALERAMLIYGAGTRQCIGKNISTSECHKLIPEILRHFELEMAHDRPWKTHNLWFNKQTDILVRLKRRV